MHSYKNNNNRKNEYIFESNEPTSHAAAKKHEALIVQCFGFCCWHFY